MPNLIVKRRPKESVEVGDLTVTVADLRRRTVELSFAGPGAPLPVCLALFGWVSLPGQVKVTVVAFQAGSVKLSIAAPAGVKILRSELEKFGGGDGESGRAGEPAATSHSPRLPVPHSPPLD